MRDPYDIRPLLPPVVLNVDVPGKPGCPQGNNPFGHNPECSCRTPDDSRAA